MKQYLCGVALIIAVASANASELIEPFPIRTAANPLVIESPFRIRLTDEGTMQVEIRKDEVLLFPVHREDRRVESGVEFHLDPGTYRLGIAKPVSPDSDELRRQEVTHIRVLPTPRSFDLRDRAFAVNVQIKEILLLLKQATMGRRAIQGSVDTLSGTIEELVEQISEISEQLQAIEEPVATLTDQFDVVDTSSGRPVPVVQPLQYMFDSLQMLSAEPATTEGTEP